MVLTILPVLPSTKTARPLTTDPVVLQGPGAPLRVDRDALRGHLVVRLAGLLQPRPRDLQRLLPVEPGYRGNPGVGEEDRAQRPHASLGVDREAERRIVDRQPSDHLPVAHVPASGALLHLPQDELLGPDPEQPPVFVHEEAPDVLDLAPPHPPDPPHHQQVGADRRNGQRGVGHLVPRDVERLPVQRDARRTHDHPFRRHRGVAHPEEEGAREHGNGGSAPRKRATP
jgi:hypothetical protein